MSTPELYSPTPEQHDILLASTTAREHRRAKRLGRAAVNHKISHRGRKREPIAGAETLKLTELTMPKEKVITLAHQLAHSQPLFDQFTNHARVDPNSESIHNYTHPRFPFQGIPRGEQQKLASKRRERQIMHVGDKLQQSIFMDLNIAKWARASLDTTRKLIGAGQPLDHVAATASADATVDFGYCLLEKYRKDEKTTPNEVETAVQIIAIGQHAYDNPDALNQNSDLLKLVQLEQKARVEYWQPRYDATTRVLGDRLTDIFVQDGIRLNGELQRLAEISAAVA